jgi:two-component system, NarL family, nitrate/nitrite response regulator NarL
MHLHPHRVIRGRRLLFRKVRLDYLSQEKENSKLGPTHVASENLVLPSANPIRILLVDEYTILREGLRLLIENQPGLLIVGEASKSEDATEVARREQPDIILLDPFAQSQGDCSILGELLSVANNARVIVLTGTRDTADHRKAICQGAKGIVLKQEASETLIKAIKKVSAGEVWLEPSTTASVLSEMVSNARDRKASPEQTKMQSLTQREREVAALAAEGLKNRDIASRLFITEATVSHHLTSIFNKLGVTDRLQLIVYVHRQGPVSATER